METLRPLIHVGYHKTGSTWLQKRVFADDAAGFCVPWAAGREEAVRAFIHPNPFHFAPAKAREAFEAGLEKARERSLVPVISHEGLSGDPMAGKYYGREVAERISRTFPDARILICIREQKATLSLVRTRRPSSSQRFERLSVIFLA